MLAKDLVYLLQTRCEPDDEIIFTGYMPDSDIEVSGDSGCSFHEVWQEEDGFAYISVGGCFVHNVIRELRTDQGKIVVESEKILEVPKKTRKKYKKRKAKK